MAEGLILVVSGVYLLVDAAPQCRRTPLMSTDDFWNCGFRCTPDSGQGNVTVTDFGTIATAPGHRRRTKTSIPPIETTEKKKKKKKKKNFLFRAALTSYFRQLFREAHRRGVAA